MFCALKKNYKFPNKSNNIYLFIYLFICLFNVEILK